MTAADAAAPLLTAQAVSQRYRLPRTKVLGRRDELAAVDAVDFHIHRGEAVSIVGESGSGKTTLARMLVGTERPTDGTLRFRGVDVWGCSREQRREYRRAVQVVLQNPRSSLDPRLRIGTSLTEPLRALAIDGDHGAMAVEALAQVGMGPEALRKYPHQFSGGQLQRIAIARALIVQPEVLIADEPVSALDVSIQAQVLNLLRDLVEQLGLSLVLIAHDLSVVAYTTSRAAVMAEGRIVEQGAPRELFEDPQAEPTRNLVDAVLTVDGGLAGTALR
jgi:ABC-type glutathione transport system ATPase component